MIVEHEIEDWMTYVQFIDVGQCFYYADELFLRINFTEGEFNDKVVTVDLSKNELKVFPHNIHVIPVSAKISVYRDESLKSKLKILDSQTKQIKFPPKSID